MANYFDPKEFEDAVANTMTMRFKKVLTDKLNEITQDMIADAVEEAAQHIMTRVNKDRNVLYGRDEVRMFVKINGKDVKDLNG